MRLKKKKRFALGKRYDCCFVLLDHEQSCIIKVVFIHVQNSCMSDGEQDSFNVDPIPILIWSY